MEEIGSSSPLGKNLVQNWHAYQREMDEVIKKVESLARIDPEHLNRHYFNTEGVLVQKGKWSAMLSDISPIKVTSLTPQKLGAQLHKLAESLLQNVLVARAALEAFKDNPARLAELVKRIEMLNSAVTQINKKLHRFQHPEIRRFIALADRLVNMLSYSEILLDQGLRPEQKDQYTRQATCKVRV